MKSHRPPLRRCATSVALDGRRCSWAMVNTMGCGDVKGASAQPEGRPLPPPPPSRDLKNRLSIQPKTSRNGRGAMAVQALGYAGFGSAALEDWRQFGTGLVGLQAVERGNSLLAFRTDDRKQRIVIDRSLPEGARFFGWEVADAAALDALAARLDAAGVAVTAEPRMLADARRVRALISFRDPAGNRLEAFYGAEIAEEPFSPGRSISGFRTGPLGLGHTVLTVENIDAGMPFYVDLLGFSLSDHMQRPFRPYFFHVNARHHSLALIETGKNGMHHLMVELFSLDDVGQCYDIALKEPD